MGIVKLDGRFERLADMVVVVADQLREIRDRGHFGDFNRDVSNLLINISHLELAAEEIVHQVARNPAAAPGVADRKLAAIDGIDMTFAEFSGVMSALKTSGQAFADATEAMVAGWDVQKVSTQVPRSSGPVTVQSLAIELSHVIPASVLSDWASTSAFTAFLADLEAAGG